MSQLFSYTHTCTWSRCLQQRILMNVQQSTAHNTAETHKAAHQHYTYKEASRYTHTHNAKLLLWALTFLCHGTAATVEHKSHSRLHCSNTFGNTNPCLYVRTLTALTVCTDAKTPPLSPFSCFGFFELWWVFLYCRFLFLNPTSTCWVSKVQTHLPSHKGSSHQISTCTVTSEMKCQVLKEEGSYFKILLFCTIYASSYPIFFLRCFFLQLYIWKELQAESSHHWHSAISPKLQLVLSSGSICLSSV